MTTVSVAQPVAPPEKMLVANFGRIGDWIITTAAIRAIHEVHPRTRIDVVCGRWASAFFSGHSWVERLVRYLHQVRSRIPVRVGFDRVPGFLLTHRTPGRRQSQEHGAKLQLGLVAPLGLLHQEERDRRYDIGRSEGSLPPAIEGLGECLVFHLVCGHPRKNWSSEKWRELLQRVSVRRPTVVLTGSMEDTGILSRICAGIERAQNLAGRLTLADLVAPLKESTRVVSADTDTAHLAGALGVPVLTVFRRGFKRALAAAGAAYPCDIQSSALRAVLRLPGLCGNALHSSALGGCSVSSTGGFAGSGAAGRMSRLARPTGHVF